ncbi:MAG: GMC family oxidoreductase [Pseudomonadota bacterium]
MGKHLSKRERKIVQCIAEVLIPLPNPEDNPETARLLASLDDHLRCMQQETAYLFKACLWFWELVAFTYYASFKLMTQMDLSLRERYLNAWHNTWWSVKRTIKRFLETIIFMNYYGLPEVAVKIGFEPKFSKPVKNINLPAKNIINHPPQEEVTDEADVCVIGSGAGGAVLAKELADRGYKVIILEEGSFFSVQDFGQDVVTMTKKLYRGGGVINTFGWPPILVPIGKCVGGTTLINSGTCFRTPEHVFEKWVNNFGLHTWTAKEMQAHYEAVEKFIKATPARAEVQSKSAKFFEQGLKKLGHELKPLQRNAPNCCGSGVCCFGCPTNAKESANLNYLPAALEQGAKLYTNCRAYRIVYHKRHATEVLGEFKDPVTYKKTGKIKIKAKVIVCAAGSLHTPVLLKQSRVPNPSGQIGHNLTLHPAAKVMALFEDEVKGWQGIPQGYYCEGLKEDRVALEGIFLQPAFTASTLLLSGIEHRQVMEQYNKLALFGMMVSDTSQGRVYSGFKGHPIPIYNINRADLPKYRRGIQFLADAFFQAGAKKLFLPLHTLPKLDRADGIKPLIELKLRNKDLDLQAFHPLGTCRMGADPREAVIDPLARVYGLDNVFIADGSIFPTSLGVNPMLTIMAAARKISGHIHREYL